MNAIDSSFFNRINSSIYISADVTVQYILFSTGCTPLKIEMQQHRVAAVPEERFRNCVCVMRTLI